MERQTLCHDIYPARPITTVDNHHVKFIILNLNLGSKNSNKIQTHDVIERVSTVCCIHITHVNVHLRTSFALPTSTCIYVRHSHYPRQRAPTYVIHITHVNVHLRTYACQRPSQLVADIRHRTSMSGAG